MPGIEDAPAPYAAAGDGTVAWNSGVCPMTIKVCAWCDRAAATIASSRDQSKTPSVFSISRQEAPASHTRNAPTGASGQEAPVGSASWTPKYSGPITPTGVALRVGDGLAEGLAERDGFAAAGGSLPEEQAASASASTTARDRTVKGLRIILRRLVGRTRHLPPRRPEQPNQWHDGAP